MPYYDDDDFGGYDDDRDFDMSEGADFEDDGQPDDLTEHEDFAHDNDWDNYIMEDQHLDGMYEE
jgi:hypothetical protein